MEFFTWFSSEEIVLKFVDGEEKIETFLWILQICEKCFPAFFKGTFYQIPKWSFLWNWPKTDRILQKVHSLKTWHSNLTNNRTTEKRVTKKYPQASFPTEKKTVYHFYLSCSREKCCTEIYDFFDIISFLDFHLVSEPHARLPASENVKNKYKNVILQWNWNGKLFTFLRLIGKVTFFI
jgi:hypothetical protein